MFEATTADRRESRQDIMDMIFALYRSLKPDGELDSEAEEQLISINLTLCAALEIEPTDPL